MKSFEELSEREILALAIASEEDDNRVYLTFAEDLHDRYPSTAKVFEEMALVEEGHHQMPNATKPRRCGCSGNCFNVRPSFQRLLLPTN